MSGEPLERCAADRRAGKKWSHRAQLAAKRVFDLTACGLILIVGLPLLLVLAMLVKRSSVGPIIFVQERIGRSKRPYKMLKFRTMVGRPDQDATRWSRSDEARITPIGQFMRDYGLDELPQLVNILRGDMSVIGPRPVLSQQLAALPSKLDRMFCMRPGVLSLAAVEGRRSLSMERRYDLHVRYVDTWSLKLDLKILWRSLFVVWNKEAAREPAE